MKRRDSDSIRFAHVVVYAHAYGVCAKDVGGVLPYVRYSTGTVSPGGVDEYRTVRYRYRTYLTVLYGTYGRERYYAPVLYVRYLYRYSRLAAGHGSESPGLIRVRTYSYALHLIGLRNARDQLSAIDIPESHASLGTLIRIHNLTKPYKNNAGPTK